MRGVLIRAAAGVAACVCMACGYPDPDDPLSPGTGFETLHVTAVMREVSSPNSPVSALAVSVTVSNSGVGTRSFTISIMCPVRIRLYRMPEFVRVYDETRLVCDYPNVRTVTMPPGAEQPFFSGTRWPWTFHGDSIPAGDYFMSAVLEMLGDPVEADIGIYRLPRCEGPYPPPPGGSIRCRHAGEEDEEGGRVGSQPITRSPVVQRAAGSRHANQPSATER